MTRKRRLVLLIFFNWLVTCALVALAIWTTPPGSKLRWDWPIILLGFYMNYAIVAADRKRERR